MALIRCEECGKKISDQAISCPSCGYHKDTSLDTNSNESLKEHDNTTDFSVQSTAIFEIIGFFGKTLGAILATLFLSATFVILGWGIAGETGGIIGFLLSLFLGFKTMFSD